MKNPYNYFTDIHKVKTFDTFRIAYFAIFLMSFFITEFGRKIYRPFIYNNNISDFGIADSIGNLGGIIVQIFFGLLILNSPKKKGIRLIILCSLGYILYEILQPILPRGVFDWRDIYGTFIGGIIGMGIFLLIHSFLNKNKVYYYLGTDKN